MAEVPSLSPVSQQGGVPMDKAYLFRDGMDEFTPPPGTKVNKQFRSQVRVFLSSPARAVSARVSTTHVQLLVSRPPVVQDYESERKRGLQ
jgi:hypothetical protein